jgi:EAL domain-containing protein (putative c-di-GMP-specific phosphodiesterase class I)
MQIDDSGDGLALSEPAWQIRLAYALEPGRPILVEFPLTNGNHGLVRLECSLRLRWEEGTDPVATAVWLPVVRRAKRTAEIDLIGVSMALEAIDIDSIPRSLRISSDALASPGFLAQLGELLGRFEDSARGLWLEVDESVALRDLRLLTELAVEVHSHGARLGLEHAGEHMVDLAALLEVGLDFVKLDASLTEGLAKDEARSQHVAGSVRMLHGIGLRVYAEVDADPRDALALWEAGVDAITGSVYTL